MEISRLCSDAEPYIIEQRRYFHRHPELSGCEKNTAAAICRQLESLGIPYERLHTCFGVVGRIDGKYPGRTIALRADTDALPVQEETDCSYASENDGVMHACGHDAHTAMLLGAARVLSEIREELHGTVLLLFQPGEENGGGAPDMVAYLKEHGGADQIIGLHIWSTVPAGEILLIPKTVFSGACAIFLHIAGRGGHGARPDLTNDPIKAACDLVLQITSIPSNYHSLFRQCVISICTFHSGIRGNIVPDSADLTGSIRYFQPDDLKILTGLINKKIRGIELIHDVTVDFTMKNDGVPPVVNNEESIRRARAIVKNVGGLAVSSQTDPICAGDNMAKLLACWPGFYGVLGAGNPDIGASAPQHSAKYRIDESVLRKGTEFMVQYAIDYLIGEASN